MKETFLYQFLTGMLFKEISSIENWAAEHFVSTSFSNKHLRKVKTFFTGFDVELDTNKPSINLKGEEWQIRYLYFQLFKEASLVDKEWPFPSLSFPAIKSFIRKIRKELDIYMNPLLEYQYALFIGVHLLRSPKATVTKMLDYDYQSWQAFTSEHDILPILEKLEETVNIELDGKDRYAILRTIEYFPVRYLSKQASHARIDYAKNLNKEAYRVAYEFMNTLEGRPENNLNQFVKYLDIVTFYDFLPLNEEIIFSPYNVATPQIIKKVNTKEVSTCLKPVISKIEQDPKYYEILVHLDQILHQIGVIFDSRKRSILPQEPVKITVISEKGYEREQYLAYLLSTIFPEEVLKVMDNKEVSVSCGKDEIDLIVADYIPNEVYSDYNWFLLSDCWDKENRNHLEQEIKKIHLEKNQMKTIMRNSKEII